MKSLLIRIKALYQKSESLRKGTRVLVYLVLFVSLALFIGKPSVLNLLSSMNTLKDLRRLENNLIDRYERVNGSYDKVSKIPNADLSLLKNALPDNSSMTTYLGSIENLALNTGVRLLSITAKDIPVDITKSDLSNLKSFTVTTKVSGAYDNIDTFLKQLKNIGRITTLQKAAINNTASSERTSDLTATIDLETYYLR